MVQPKVFCAAGLLAMAAGSLAAYAEGGGGCPACADPCTGHCANGITDCGETGRDCGGECAACDQGFCAGRHEEGHTDEIAVSNTGCTGRWFGYHIYNYGGGKVVWNPGAQRGWWCIEPEWCP